MNSWTGNENERKKKQTNKIVCGWQNIIYVAEHASQDAKRSVAHMDMDCFDMNIFYSWGHSNHLQEENGCQLPVAISKTTSLTVESDVCKICKIPAVYLMKPERRGVKSFCND